MIYVHIERLMNGGFLGDLIMAPIKAVDSVLGGGSKVTAPPPAPDPIVTSGGSGDTLQETADKVEDEGATFAKKSKLKKGSRSLKIPTSTGGGGNVGR